MYIPDHFAETDLAVLHDFIERHSFGQLVSQVDGVPFATHLPFLVEKTTGNSVVLSGTWHEPTRIGSRWASKQLWRSFPGRTLTSRQHGTRPSRSYRRGITSPFTLMVGPR